MRISGFSMVRNATKIQYPVRQSIESLLPLVDEFCLALGKGDEDDYTEEEVKKIGSDKVKIIHTDWDIEKYPRGMVHAQQTDVAKSHCSGDWLFYIQADEVVHEEDLPKIKAQCEKYLNDPEVEGLIFDYLHFWGDYDHVHNSHKWYPHEIRIVRNDPEIHSWESAQSFRRIPDFDGVNYRIQEGTKKLKVAPANARIFHYGYVRPPDYQQRKRLSSFTNHKGRERAQEVFKELPPAFDYGPLGPIPVFKKTHPAVMKELIDAVDWKEQLNYGWKNPTKVKHAHRRLKYRLLTFIELYLLFGKRVGTFKNYIKVRNS